MPHREQVTKTRQASTNMFFPPNELSEDLFISEFVKSGEVLGNRKNREQIGKCRRGGGHRCFVLVMNSDGRNVDVTQTYPSRLSIPYR
jgi:hypothetical protein